MTPALSPPDRVVVQWCPKCGATFCAQADRRHLVVRLACSCGARFVLVRYQLAAHRGDPTKRARKAASRKAAR